MLLEVISGMFKQSHSQLILNRSLSGAVGMVCDVRLGILLACEIALLTTEANFFDIILIILTMVLSWLPLHLFSKYPQTLVRGYAFPLSDLTVSVILIFSLRENYYGIQHLLFAYILTSALLEGLLVNLSYKVIWSSAVIVALALSRSQSQTLATSLTVFVVLSFGVVFGIVLGDRLRSQFEDIDRLTEESMNIRAEERALTERLTIARDLHDSLAKSVHGIRMLAETLTADLEETQHRDSTLSRTLFESADEASREARLILDGLRVGDHGQNSLLDRLIGQAHRWGARTGVEVICSQTGGNSDHQSFSSEVVWHIQRILGEILTNIEKHAHATAVFVDLSVDSASLRIETRDNGVGLSPGCVHTPAEGHYGIAGMFERAHILHATLTIDGQSADGGVHTVLTVPLDSLDSVEGAA
jgi:integral membrane sensor signal transduction histidine kinase